MNKETLLIVGSVALRGHAGLSGHNNFRIPEDVDCICSFETMKNLLLKFNPLFHSVYPIDNGKKYIAKHKFLNNHKEDKIYEFEIAWENSTAKEFLDIMVNNDLGIRQSTEALDYIYTPSAGLYAMKMSHRYLKNSPHFLKTMKDIHLLRQILGTSEIDPLYKDWFLKREKETYDYKHPTLVSASKDNFFNKDETFYVYDHDDIHKAIAINRKPAYRFYMKDGAEVECSKEKFFEQDDFIKNCGVMEEAMVLALERCLIPNDFKVHPDKAFEMAMMKVCTSITSGWFREYAWENYFEVMDLYNKIGRNYGSVFLDAVMDNEVGKFKR